MNPKLTVLSFSGGKQSSCLLWMAILNKIEVPKNFIVLTADPGMENSDTYKYVDMMFEKCKAVGIEAYKVDGPNLYQDILTLKQMNKTRLDNPPYWTKNIQTGKMGRLTQGCTQHYKIEPMDRFIRQYLYDKFKVSKEIKRLRPNMVEKWIGFSYSEVERIKPAKQKYMYFRYPLIDLKMSNADVVRFFVDNNLPISPRSVCNACFANGLDTFREMYQRRPNDWKQAVAVDSAIRDWSQIGVRDEVYVSNTILPLETLAEKRFVVSSGDVNDKEKDYSCDSGYCFL